MMRAFAVVAVVAALGLTACDRSDNSRVAGAVADDSQVGVVTAPQLGHLNEQPNITGQLNVTTATTATSPTNTLGGGVAKSAGADSATSDSESASKAPDAK